MVMKVLLSGDMWVLLLGTNSEHALHLLFPLNIMGFHCLYEVYTKVR